LTWIGLGTSIFSISGNGVSYNGELWIAVGSGVNNTIAYSNDGLNWSGLGKTIFSTSGTAILYKNKMWVATGQGTNAIAYSLNGINWTNVVNTPLTNGLSVGYSGHKWLASGTTSTDVKKIRVRRVSQDNTLNVAAAIRAITMISSTFKDFFGITYAAIATIIPSTRYLIILFTSSVKSKDPDFYNIYYENKINIYKISKTYHL
jgi:hypothetical protein